MTLRDIEAMTTPTITAAVAAQVLGCDPHMIRVQAHQDASKLGFPVVVVRRRVKIPREPFLNYMKGERYV